VKKEDIFIREFVPSLSPTEFKKLFPDKVPQVKSTPQIFQSGFQIVPNYTLSNIYVPEHRKLSEAEIEELFENKDFDKEQLPKIKIHDPQVKYNTGFKKGDVLEITRIRDNSSFVTYRYVK